MQQVTGGSVSCDECEFERLSQSNAATLTCDDLYVNCFITCDQYQKCRNADIYCSSSNENCILFCTDDYSWQGITFYSTNVPYAGVYSLDKNALIDAVIYSPIGGDLKVFASNALERNYDQNYMTKFITNTKFYANDSNTVYFECGGQGAGSNRIICDKNNFYVQSGNYLQFDCLAGANCSQNIFRCPLNTGGIACQVGYDSGVGHKNSYYVENGINRVC